MGPFSGPLPYGQRLSGEKSKRGGGVGAKAGYRTGVCKTDYPYCK